MFRTFLWLIFLLTFLFFSPVYAVEESSEKTDFSSQKDVSDLPTHQSEYERLRNEAERLRIEIDQLDKEKAEAEDALLFLETEGVEDEGEYAAEETSAAKDSKSAKILQKTQRVRYYSNRLRASETRLVHVEQALKEVEAAQPGTERPESSLEEKVVAKSAAKKEGLALIPTATAALPDARAAALVPRDEEVEAEKRRIQKKYESPREQRLKMRDAMREKMSRFKKKEEYQEKAQKEAETVTEPKEKAKERAKVEVKEKVEKISEPEQPKEQPGKIESEAVSEEARLEAKRRAEEKALAKRREVEEKALRDKKKAEEKAAKDAEKKRKAEEKALAEKRKAEEKALRDKKKAEEKAAKDAEKKRKAEEKALKEKQKAEQKAIQEKRKAEEKAVAEKKKPEEKALKEKKEAEEKALKEQEEAKREAISEKVEALREREWEKFKDIDKGFFKERYTEDYYIKQQDFLAKIHKNFEDCIKRAIEIHTPTLVAEERRGLAKRKRVKAFRDLFPKAEFEFEYRRGSLSHDAWMGNDYHMKFRQPAFRGGELWYTFLQEDANVRVTEAEYEQVTSELFLDVSKAYFEFMRTRNVQLAREVAYEASAACWEISREKWKEGLIAEIEYLNVESLYNQASHDVEAAKQDSALASLELERYLGIGADETIDIPLYFDFDRDLSIHIFTEDWIPPGENGAVLMEDISDDNLDKFVQLAYDNRPDLDVEVERLRSARYGRKAARGGWFPQCDLIVEWGQTGEAYKDRNGIILQDLRHKRDWRFGLELSWNVGGTTFKYVYDNDLRAPTVTQYLGGDGTMERKNTFTASFLDDLQQFVDTKETRVTEVEQILELEDKEREVIRDVKESYFDFRKSYVQLKSTIKRLEYKKKLVELSKHRLSLNDIQVSEYLQSEIELSEERANLYRAVADFYIAKASMNRAVGIRDYFPVKYFTTTDEINETETD